MLEVANVSKSYAWPGRAGEVCVLRDISLKLDAGGSLAIVGPSGSGKSTLLNIIGGLDRADGGQVLLAGKDLSQQSEAELARIRNQEIGIVFQSHLLLRQCTVLENVLVPTLVNKDRGSRKAAEGRARGLLDRVGLGDWQYHRPGELSGGQRQRVAVVRALINRPKLLLADEPTGSLDRDSAEGIAELLVELNRSEAVTMIVVTHSLKLAERIGPVKELGNGVLTERQSG
jgi:ABC-type lipoprotein export system ATPase subunit